MNQWAASAGASPCAACGKIAAAGAVDCPACGEPLLPLLEDRLPETLPPIPDGGLASGMPAWLRVAPIDSTVATAPAASGGRDVLSNDPATFLGADDLPAWLRAIGRAGAPDAQPDSMRAALEESPYEFREPLFLPDAPLPETASAAAVASERAVAPLTQDGRAAAPNVAQDTGIPRSVILLLLVVALAIAAVLVLASIGG